MKPTADLLTLIDAGGHIDLSTFPKPTADLVTLASAARARGTKLIISGNKPTAELVTIIQAGGDVVTVAWPKTN